MINNVVYQDVRTNEIVVAHRGTSSLMDVNVDLKMVIHKFRNFGISIMAIFLKPLIWNALKKSGVK